MLPLAVILALPVACSEPPETMTLLSREGSNPQLLRLIDEWNRENELQIRATLVPQRDFMTKFGVSLAGGIVPDLVAIDLIYMPRFTSIGQLLDITELVKAMPYHRQLVPSHVRLSTWDGRIYGIPFAVEGSFLLYNKALFVAAGLDPDKPPRDWQTLIDYAQQISATGTDTYGFYFSGACGGCAIFTIAPLIWASGGDIANEAYTESRLTSPEVQDVLQMYRTLWESGSVPAGAIVDGGENFSSAFLSGNIGMVAAGAFVIEQLDTRYTHIDYGISLLPGQHGGASSFAGGDVIAIPKQAKHIDEARAFIRWFTERDVQERSFAAFGALPVRLDLADHPAYASPEMRVAIEAVAIGRTPMTPRYNDLIGDLNGPWTLMVQSAIFEKDIDSAVRRADRQFQKIMDE
jgi:multiple sugar transport system substrate-binding protein